MNASTETNYFYVVRSASFGTFTQLNILPVATVDASMQGDNTQYDIKLKVRNGLNDHYSNINGVLTSEQKDQLLAIADSIDSEFRSKIAELVKNTSTEFGRKLGQTSLSLKQAEYILVHNEIALNEFKSVREQIEKAEKVSNLAVELLNNLPYVTYEGKVACNQIAKYLVENGKLK